MLPQKRHKLFIFVFVGIILINLCRCTNRQATDSDVPRAADNFEVIALNVGKADSLILKTENHAVLIDCGEKGDGDEILDALSKSGIESIDCLTITHFDKDHVGGAAKIIKNIGISRIITPDYDGDSAEYKSYLSAAETAGLASTRLTQKLTFVLDDVLFEIYPPEQSKYDESDNDYSLALRATHGNNKFLFAGDAKEERLSEFKDEFPLSHTFLKVPHHGRYNGYTKKFIDAVSPELAVITCSKKNPPDSETLSVLDSVGCQTFLTENVTAKFISDGKNIRATQ